MDKLLGSIIDDYTLYRIIESIITILILVAVYLGVHITLMMKFPKKSDAGSDSNSKRMLTRSSIYIFILGFFMLLHEFTEGLEKEAIDYTTYEFFELVAFLGLVMFLYEWNKILRTRL